MTAIPGTLPELLDQLARALERKAARRLEGQLDQPVALVRGRRLQTIGNLHLYEFFLSSDAAEAVIDSDLPVTLLLGDETEPTEGIVLAQEGPRLILQIFDALGEVVAGATLIPDLSGFALSDRDLA